VRMKRTAAVLGRCGPVRKQRSFGCGKEAVVELRELICA
jgi:hypothetical protein